MEIALSIQTVLPTLLKPFRKYDVFKLGGGGETYKKQNIASVVAHHCIFSVRAYPPEDRHIRKSEIHRAIGIYVIGKKGVSEK